MSGGMLQARTRWSCVNPHRCGCSRAGWLRAAAGSETWGFGVSPRWGNGGSAGVFSHLAPTRGVCGVSRDGGMAALWLFPSPSQRLSRASLLQAGGQFANWMVLSISPCSVVLGGGHILLQGLHPTPAPPLSHRTSPPSQHHPWDPSCPSPVAPWGIPPNTPPWLAAPTPSANPTLPSAFLTNPMLPCGSLASQSCAATCLCCQPIPCCHPCSQPILCCPWGI